ncbi:MAG: hypothetical protein KC543_08285 [Myxococcales bacterium]|nr:hypothetical protein [Myxococcales bacterium]
MNVAILLVALAIGGLLALSPRARGSDAWRATVTPLSSIMGSGFLISAPLLVGATGAYAPLAMGGLLLVAYGIGSMLRFNIRWAERDADGGADAAEHRLHRGHREGTQPHWTFGDRQWVRRIERASHVVLAGAYIISIAYYLQLLSAFVLDRFSAHDPTAIRALTTAVLVTIAAVGATAGLRALERVETYAVSLNLGVIVALLGALAAHALGLIARGAFTLPALSPGGDRWHSARVVMGLLIVVQGFETSRFLGSAHPREQRVRTMRAAQLVASVIYLVFVSLMLPLFDGHDYGTDVTAIIALVTPVAVVLPTLVFLAAIGSQFSAAVADDAGCAGLIRTIASGRLPSRAAYALIGAATISVTWCTDVLSVISLASRAFALFYAMQCLVAVLTATHEHHPVATRWRVRVLGSLLAVTSLGAAVLGVPAG